MLTILCGGLYPLIVTTAGLVFFKDKAQGSLIKVDGKIVGSELLVQEFKGEAFFHPRPTGGPTQASATQKVAIALREKRRALEPLAGVDAWTSSGSGLDPHISPQTAYAQIPRVAASRGMNNEDLKNLIDRFTEAETLGIWGQPRVNVLKLNLALMSAGKNGHTGSTSRDL